MSIKEIYSTIVKAMLEIGLEHDDSTVETNQFYAYKAKLHISHVCEYDDELPESAFSRLVRKIDSKMGMVWDDKNIQENSTSVFDTGKAKFSNDETYISISYMCNKMADPDDGFLRYEAHLTVEVDM